MASMDGTRMKNLRRTARCSSENERFGKLDSNASFSSWLMEAQLSGLRADASVLRNVSISCSVMALICVASQVVHELVHTQGKVAGIGVCQSCADVGECEGGVGVTVWRPIEITSK